MPNSRSHRLIFAALCWIASTGTSGCSSRVILVPTGEPVMLAESVKARVFVTGADGKQVKSRNRVIIPAGWYALPKE